VEVAAKPIKNQVLAGCAIEGTIIKVDTMWLGLFSPNFRPQCTWHLHCFTFV